MEKPKGIKSVFTILNWVPMLWIPQNHYKGESETTIVLSKASEFQTIFNNYQTPNKDSSETALHLYTEFFVSVWDKSWSCYGLKWVNLSGLASLIF